MNARPLLLALAFASTAPLSAQTSYSLPRSTPERQGISSSAILAFVQAADTGVDMMNSFMLVRHGHVVAEGWWGPYDARTPHVLYSLSKSFTSTAVGLAISEGKLSLDDEVLKFFPDQAPVQPSANLRAMRVRDLLRMNTGQVTEPSIMTPADSTLRDATWAKRFLFHPVMFKPGTHFLYNSPATYMLSAMVQKVTGQTVLDYLRPRLFAPLGIESPTWMASPQGISAGAYGLNVRTEDIARFGQLYLQKGKWNGRQLIPAAWVEEATTRQTSNGSNPQSDWDQGYAYQFWRSRHGFRGDGAFGQYMLILPEYDAVVAITSGVRDMQSVMNIVWDKLLPAMSPEPLPEDATARRALEAKLAKLAVKVPAGRSTSPLAAKVSGVWYDLPANDRNIGAVSLDLTSSSPTLIVRTTSGETRTPIGLGSWIRSRTGFANGIEHSLSVPEHPEVAASGAWTSDSVFTVKIVAPQTPFYSTLSFHFDRDRLLIDSEQNVNFGETKLPRLEGRATAAGAQSPLTPYQSVGHDLLRELVETNTTYSAGSTTRAAEALAVRFRAAGFPAADVQIVGPDSGRDAKDRNLVVRYRGKGTRRPVLLIGHLDVVEARREDWVLDPFTLTERNGYFYGRGTLDMKNGDASWVAALLRMKQEGIVPAGDYILALTAGEEGGGGYNGIAWLLAHRRDLIDGAYALNADAGGGELRQGRPIAMDVQAAEKVFQTYRLTVRSPGGHSSLPEKDNAIYRLSAALEKLATYEFPLRTNAITRAYFALTAPLSETPLASDLSAVASGAVPDSAAAARLARVSPFYNAQLRTTCVATMIQGGHAVNALPQRVTATVNCRILPDVDPKEVERAIRTVVADTAVMVARADTATASPPSPLPAQVEHVIRDVTAAIWGPLPIIPVMETGATDGLFLRNAAIPVYGVSGYFVDLNNSADVRAHGLDERIGVKAFYDQLEFTYRLLKAL